MAKRLIPPAMIFMVMFFLIIGIITTMPAIFQGSLMQLILIVIVIFTAIITIKLTL